VGGQPRASTDLVERGSPNRNASHTTPLTVLAEGGVIGLALYAWLLGAAAWAFYLVATRRDRILGVALAAVLLVLVVHSLLYAGFFEDPLTWGVLALAAAALAAPRPPAPVPQTGQAH
jgi:O-antigen ligase